MNVTMPGGRLWVDIDSETRMNVNNGGADTIQLEFWEQGDSYGRLLIQGNRGQLAMFARNILEFAAREETGK